MIVSNNSTDGRVEVTFGIQRSDDGKTVTLIKRTRTTPVTGMKTHWSKASEVEEHLFDIDPDLIPDLLRSLGFALTLEPGDWS